MMTRNDPGRALCPIDERKCSDYVIRFAEVHPAQCRVEYPRSTG